MLFTGECLQLGAGAVEQGTQQSHGGICRRSRRGGHGFEPEASCTTKESDQHGFRLIARVMREGDAVGFKTDSGPGQETMAKCAGRGLHRFARCRLSRRNPPRAHRRWPPERASEPPDELSIGVGVSPPQAMMKMGDTQLPLKLLREEREELK